MITREWALRVILSKYVAISEFAEALKTASAGFLFYFMHVLVNHLARACFRGDPTKLCLI